MSQPEPKILELDPTQYPGGIAIWGALPPVYDTSDSAPDSGVHVHARVAVGGPKSIDETFDLVVVTLPTGQSAGDTFKIRGEDASAYNISTILKKRVTYLRCPECQAVHADTDTFAVIYHQQHVCEHCGCLFQDEKPSISNPVMLLKELCGDTLQDRIIIDPVDRKVVTKQVKWPGGMQIWGSNPAVLWTSPKPEEGGAHFHGFMKRGLVPSADETFGVVSIDGVVLEPEMVRHLMVQQELAHVAPYLCSLDCPHCGASHFDTFDQATVPHAVHMCANCRQNFPSPDEMPLTISNPLVRIRQALYENYRQIHK